MRKTFLYRMYPSKHQRKALEATLEECRWLYNNTLAYRKEAWEQEQRNVSYYDSKARIPLLKVERPSLKSVHSQVLQNITERVELAFQAFFRRVKNEEELGYPRFKGKGVMTASPIRNLDSALSLPPRQPPTIIGCASPRLAVSSLSITARSRARSRRSPFIVPRLASGMPLSLSSVILSDCLNAPLRLAST